MGGKEVSVKFILLVEDNDFSAKLIMSLLMYIPSYFVVHVRDSCGALEIFEEVLPDLLLLDYQLPIMNVLSSMICCLKRQVLEKCQLLF